MQKWEYLFLEASPYPFGDRLINLYVNGQELRDWKEGSLHQFVNQLGDEGWELVDLHHDPKYDHNYLIFKRPKPVKKTTKAKTSTKPKDP